MYTETTSIGAYTTVGLPELQKQLELLPGDIDPDVTTALRRALDSAHEWAEEYTEVALADRSYKVSLFDEDLGRGVQLPRGAQNIQVLVDVDVVDPAEYTVKPTSNGPLLTVTDTWQEGTTITYDIAAAALVPSYYGSAILMRAHDLYEFRGDGPTPSSSAAERILNFGRTSENGFAKTDNLL